MPDRHIVRVSLTTQADTMKNADIPVQEQQRISSLHAPQYS